MVHPKASLWSVCNNPLQCPLLHWRAYHIRRIRGMLLTILYSPWYSLSSFSRASPSVLGMIRSKTLSRACAFCRYGLDIRHTPLTRTVSSNPHISPATIAELTSNTLGRAMLQSSWTLFSMVTFCSGVMENAKRSIAHSFS